MIYGTKQILHNGEVIQTPRYMRHIGEHVQTAKEVRQAHLAWLKEHRIYQCWEEGPLTAKAPWHNKPTVADGRGSWTCMHCKNALPIEENTVSLDLEFYDTEETAIGREGNFDAITEVDLTENQKRVLVGKEEGDTLQSIADEVGATRQATNNTLRRIERRLRKAVGNE